MNNIVFFYFPLLGCELVFFIIRVFVGGRLEGLNSGLNSKKFNPEFNPGACYIIISDLSLSRFIYFWFVWMFGKNIFVHDAILTAWMNECKICFLFWCSDDSFVCSLFGSWIRSTMTNKQMNQSTSSQLSLMSCML